MGQKIAQEVSNQLKMKDSQMMSSDHQSHLPGRVRPKRPHRPIPINTLSLALYWKRNNRLIVQVHVMEVTLIAKQDLA